MIRSTLFIASCLSITGVTATFGQIAESEKLQGEAQFLDIEYSAEFLPNANSDRGYFLRLIPLSQEAREIDAKAIEGLTDWMAQTTALLREVSLKTETEFSARVVSRQLLREAFSTKNIEQTAGWEETGLTVGYAPMGLETSVEAFAATDWANGVAFVLPAGDLQQDHSKDGVVLARLKRDTVAGLDRARMRDIAREAAEELFGSAAESACGVIPRPAEISPSVAVSFNLFAGAEFSISATYVVDDLCEQLGLE